MRLRESVTIRAPLDRVWSLVADLDAEPRFWRGTVSVRTTARHEDVVERDVVVAGGRAVQRERVRFEPPHRVVHEILDGPVRGFKVLELQPHGDGTIEVTATWEVRPRGLLRLFQRSFGGHVAQGTRNALLRIRDAAEGRGPG